MAFGRAAAAVDDDEAFLELNGFGNFWIKPVTASPTAENVPLAFTWVFFL